MQNYVFRQKFFEKQSNQSAIRLFKDTCGAIWIYSVRNIYKIKLTAEGEIDRIFKTANRYEQSPPTAAFSDIDGDGNVWAGFGDGRICKLFENENGTLNEIPVSTILDFEKGTIFSAFVQKENEIWIGTDVGLARYDRMAKTFKTYVNNPDNGKSLSQNHISDIALAKDNTLLISTLKGINIYNSLEDNFEHLAHDDWENVERLNSNFVNCITVDGNRIWLGTESAGIALLTPKKLTVSNFVHNKNNPHSLSANPVNAIYEDKNGFLWVGTVEGGLNRKSPNEQDFIHFTMTTTDLAHNSVSAITVDHKNQLWLGTWGGGITVCDIKNDVPKVVKQVEANYDNTRFSVNFVGTLCLDTLNNGMWAGCNQGIFFYNFSAEALENPFANIKDDNFNGIIGSVIYRNQLWLGCMNGVYIIDLLEFKKGQLRYTLLSKKLDEPQSALTEKITSFCLSKNGTLWLGSNGYGFYKLLPGENSLGKFVCYSTDDGLINNNVRGITEDFQGNLWISTNNGLSRFNPRDESFRNFTKSDGLFTNEFYWNAYCTSADGTLYFGALNGMIAIDASIPVLKNEPSEVVLTGLWVANKQVFGTGGALKMHESSKYFSIEFSALNFDAAAAKYSYKLEGFDEQWTDIHANSPVVNYTNIPSGTYNFLVRYNTQGIDNDKIPVTRLKITVKPYFYKTWWFYTIVVVCLIVSAAYTYERRVKTLTRQKKTLSRTVEKRTAELNRQKLLLEKQTLELSEKNKKLISQNEKISRQKQQLLDMSAKIEQLETEDESRDKRLMNKILEVLEKNYRNPEFNATEFIAAMNIGKTPLSHKIKSLTGQTIGEFIRNYRLELARELLVQNSKTKNRNISEIAYEVGYNDPKYFTRVFSKHFGVPPSAVS
jgi:ligand-binding sensor domain-containing protein/AraC-like DNA-binding protein